MHILELSDYASTSAVTLEALAAVAMHVASEPTRVVFGVGAGISTAAGIPDFRGGATSLYGAESVRHPTRSHSTLDTRLATTRTAARTKDLFHHDVLLRLESRAEHLGMMATLRKAAKRVTRKGKERTISDGAANAARGAPTAFHGLMKRVAENGRLMRVYSQNIDGLEAAAGLVSPPPRFAETEAGGDRKTRSRIEADDSSSDFDRPRRKTPRRRAPTLAPSPQDLPVVALHGSLDHVHCSVCHHREKWKKRHTRAYKRGRRLPCPNCHDRGRTIDPAPLAFLRPAVVLYDDPSFASSPAAHLISSTIEADMRSEPACLVVAGTSLRIPGFRSLVKDLSRVVKRNGGWSILVNRENVGKEWDRFFDFHCTLSMLPELLTLLVLILRRLVPVLGDTEVFANHLTAFLDSLLPAASPTLADLPPDVTLAPPLASQTPVLESSSGWH
ncbi:hypothetical protein BMF94_1750 [Rhodotorula taiwanensis]|uniref:Deacetylase sirtuin-type domain-containing protein n=1 Tax=Rhodotorula taiwanensis TaxID=741276 RepID=A0A2S5BED2_9BASI|nr:hypothetical protein BMF94_1750 [Rhodotorula taiwanensis]